MTLVASATATCKSIKAETDLNGLRLGDADSARRVLDGLGGQPFDREIGADGAHSGSEILGVFNRDRTEMATSTQYPGTSLGVFLAIEVRAGAATPYKTPL